MTKRHWVVTVLVGALAAAVTFLGLIQVRHWLVDEQQLHEIVALIQSGRIAVAPEAGKPGPVLPAPAPVPKKD